MKTNRFILAVLAAASAVSCNLPFKENVDPQANWGLMIEEYATPGAGKVVMNQDSAPAVSRNGREITYSYKNVGGREIEVDITYAPALDGKALEIRPVIRNNDEKVFVKRFIHQELPVGMDPATSEVLFPKGVGMKVTAPESPEKKSAWDWSAERNCYSISGNYPSNQLSMQWMTVTGSEGGVYVASHDKTFKGKSLIIRYYPETAQYKALCEAYLALHTGESCEAAPLLIYGYEGSWHNAADIYSDFFHANRQTGNVPEWVQNSTGWMLTILKQQNAEIMWPYPTLGEELTKVADDRGLDIIGLFGWATGGHDRFYPDYIPDPDMGGVEGVRKGIAEAKAKGKRIIIYANGQLIDENGTEFWGDTGRFISVQLPDGSIKFERWQKYSDAPARIHAIACHHTEVWKRRMLNLALQANDLGADGILYDQLAVWADEYCYSTGHGHKTPALVYAEDKYTSLEYVRDYMKKVNPEFIIMTEGIADSEMNTISMFHGQSYGAYPANANMVKRMHNPSDRGAYFPAMFRYTMPEWLSTNRNPCPANSRIILNYCTTYGFRNELESRYAADVTYLTTGNVPDLSEYGNVMSKPDQTLLRTQNAEDIKNYSKQVLDFWKANSDFFFKGRFMDTKGFSIDCPEGSEVFASSFVAGNRMGVVVWNTSDTKSLSYSLTAPGYRQVGVSAPDKKVAGGDAIAPQSLHFVIFEK